MALSTSPVAGVKIANGIEHRQVLGVGLKDLFVLGNGVLQLALLDILLRSAENFLFVEAETKRHKSADSSLLPPQIMLKKPESIPQPGRNGPPKHAEGDK